MDGRENGDREVAQLAGPNMPSDRGLASLGLLMQLGGSLFGGYMALFALLPIFTGLGAGSLVLFLIGAAGAIRSGFHRAAGTGLLYGASGGAFRPTYAYAGVAALQTAATLVLLNHDGALALHTNASIALVLLAWPAALVVLLTRRRLRELARDEVLPISEDFGFEGSATLMVLFGVLGALAALFLLVLSFQLPGSAMGPFSLLIVGVLAMLLVRSILHTAAGVKGTRGIDSDGATESAARYFGFGVISSVMTGGVLIIVFMSIPGVGLYPAMFLAASAAVYVLLSWPLILRRFYTDRNFSALLAGAQGPNYRRAPDAGMTAVGWLLVAMGVLQVGLALPGALAGDADLAHILGVFDVLDLGLGALAPAGHSTWWSVGIGAVQLWAGLEVVHMTDRHRLVATAYGLVTAAATIYVLWPQLQALELAAAEEGLSGLSALAGSFRIALTLVVPVGTIALVNRKLLPSARARVRPSAGE